MLVDDKGKPLNSREKSREEVLKRLQDLAPKNKEQQELLVKKVAEFVERNRKRKLLKGLEDDFDGVFEDNTKRRTHRANWTPNKDYRHIASIPRDMAYVAEQVFGPEVWTDKAVFKQAFKEDETGRLCLTVDPDTI